MRLGVLVWLAVTVLAAACGNDYTVLHKATSVPATPTAIATPSPRVATAIAGTAVVLPATVTSGDATQPPVPSAATRTPPPPAATLTPGPPGQTGIAGAVTIGPTCPVQRVDDPCPNRPYEATITIWQGATKVGETRSDAGGRYTIELPPGSYRVVGESPGTLPRGSEQVATVEPWRITIVDLQYDSGIR